MELLVKNSPNHYDTNDTIDMREDGFQWSTGALQSSVFTVVTGVTVTEDDEKLLKQNDEGVKNFSAVSKLPTFRSLSMGREQLKEFHRRKYQYEGGVVKRKANAQVRD